jgi:hypothetical protein
MVITDSTAHVTRSSTQVPTRRGERARESNPSEGIAEHSPIPTQPVDDSTIAARSLDAHAAHQADRVARPLSREARGRRRTSSVVELGI